ncbi:hypothetical protein LCGC14_1279450 [marine sediment metagenome]|uniref:Uncharacterized protein n=1 Tax=marine sediment metagenome TaxID=412755 RepID=A0A0F9KVN8_9ZZZZ
MGESRESTESTKSSKITKEELSGSKVVAFIGVLILVAGAINSFLAAGSTTAMNIIFGILALFLALVIFISLEFIDLGPVKVPYLWYLTLIIGVVLIILAFFTTAPSTTPVTPKPYLGGVLVSISGIVEYLIQQQKREVVVSKFVAFAGAAFTIYQSILLFFVAPTAVIFGIIGIIIAVILVILVMGKIDIKIPYNWWTVLIIAFIVFTWIDPVYAGIAGTVLMVAFILIIIGF